MRSSLPPPIEPANVETVLAAHIPVVQVERPTQVQSHKVLVDNHAGAVSAVEHLIGLGHERIGYIGGDQLGYRTDLSVDEQRLSGYRDALRNHGIQPLDEWYASGKYYSLEDGYHIMEKFLERGQVTAVLTACDILAAGALQAIYQRNLRVPKDISVVGFDDTYASYLSPPLTTVQQPMFEIGQTAARIAIEALDREALDPEALDRHPLSEAEDYRVEHLSTRLTIRASTGQPKQ